MLSTSSLQQFLDHTLRSLPASAAQKVAEWRPTPDATVRILKLGIKAEQRTLTEAEESEYECYIEEGDLIALWQATARRMLTDQRE